jgi:hypothetical protein
VVNGKLVIMLILVGLVAFSAPQRTATALPFDSETTDQVLAPGEWWEVSGALTSGDVITGYFETHSPTQGIDFFICDQTNYDLWVGSATAYVYNLEEDMHTLGFSFTVSASGTWYIMFSNEAGSTSVTLDMGVDVNGDGTPYYSSAIYDITRYGEVLENDEYYYVTNTYEAGTTISGHFSTFFPSDGVDFFICDADNYDLWSSGYDADVYGLKEDMHQASITEFVLPTSGQWYFVFSAIGQADTVTLSYGIQVEAGSGTTTPIQSVDMSFLLIGGVAIVGVVGIVGAVLYMSSRKKDDMPPPMPNQFAGPYQPPSSPGVAHSDQDLVLGALRSYPRVGMDELAELLDMTEDDVRRITLKLIASGAISGTFDRASDEFTSVTATSVGRELRKDMGGPIELPRCPNCGAPVRADVFVGDTVECDSCGVKFQI